MITLDTARVMFTRVARVAERHGYIASLYGSTLLHGVGNDIDILVSPVTPLALMPPSVFVEVLLRGLGCEAMVTRDAMGYYAHAFIISGKLENGALFSIDLAVRYQNADEAHKRGWDEAQIFKKERFALSVGTEVYGGGTDTTVAPLMEASDD